MEKKAIVEFMYGRLYWRLPQADNLKLIAGHGRVFFADRQFNNKHKNGSSWAYTQFNRLSSFKVKWLKEK